jgi:uncharacterized protein YecT (DUF1311 family)
MASKGRRLVKPKMAKYREHLLLPVGFASIQNMQPASRMPAIRRNALLIAGLYFLLQPNYRSEAQSTPDDALNRTYKAIVAKLTPAGREQLRKIERAWLTFVELDRAAMRAAAARLHLSAADEQKLQTNEIEARIEQLEELAYTTSEPEDAKAFRVNDAQLNVIYQRCISSMTSAEVEALRKAQRAWLVFREESRKFGGRVGARITAARTDQLNAFYIQSPTPDITQADDKSVNDEKADRTTPDPFERGR